MIITEQKFISCRTYRHMSQSMEANIKERSTTKHSFSLVLLLLHGGEWSGGFNKLSDTQIANVGGGLKSCLCFLKFLYEEGFCPCVAKT
nr:hypothetical protein [Tanacetum cinerariifolium]